VHPAGSEVLSLLVRGLSGRLVQPPARVTSGEYGAGGLGPLPGDPRPVLLEKGQENPEEEADGAGKGQEEGPQRREVA